MKRQIRISPSAQACFALIALQLVCSVHFIPQLGFYHDDWDFLDRFNGPSGVLQLTRDLFMTYAPRPPLSFIFSCLISTGGEEAAVYQTILAAMSAFEAILLYNLCRRLALSRPAAFIAAAAAIVYPGRNGNRLWFSNSPQNVALILMLGSLIFHLDWLRTRRPWRLVAGQALALVGGLTYESLLFMPLMAVLPRAMARRHGPERLAEALRRTALEFSPYLATILLILLWKTVGLRAIGVPNPKEAAPSLVWTMTVYREAVYCLFIWPFRAAAGALRAAFRQSSPTEWALAVAGTASLAFGSRGRWASSRSRAAVLWAAGGALLAAYFPYALSGAYCPVPMGVMSRVNGAGAWAFGLIIAALLSLLPWRRSATAAVLLPLVIVNWDVSRQWVNSWEAQKAILSRAVRHTGEFAENARVALIDAPLVTPGGVGVFTSSWDFNGALHVVLGRRDLEGTVLRPPTQQMLDQFALTKTDRPRCVFSFKGDLVKCLPASTSPPAAEPGGPPG